MASGWTFGPLQNAVFCHKLLMFRLSFSFYFYMFVQNSVNVYDISHILNVVLDLPHTLVKQVSQTEEMVEVTSSYTSLKYGILIAASCYFDFIANFFYFDIHTHDLIHSSASPSNTTQF